MELSNQASENESSNKSMWLDQTGWQYTSLGNKCQQVKLSSHFDYYNYISKFRLTCDITFTNKVKSEQK